MISLCTLLFAATAGFAAENPQLVWLAPLPNTRLPDGRIGAVDYMNLFSPAAPWISAASRVQVFKIYALFNPALPGALTDSQWRQLFADLDRRGIALALEWGPLLNTTCGIGVEGFGDASALTTIQKIKSLGGNLRYLAMDEPFYGASIFNGANACQWTPKQTAADAVRNIAQVRAIFPNVIVGDIEPAPPPGAPDWVQRYTEWLDAWKEAAGTPLAFFHLDVNYPSFPNWVSDVDPFRRVLAGRSIPLGVIYNGLSAKTDSDWMRAAEDHIFQYEVLGGNKPEQAVFQTWESLPTHVLPETDPNALTYLVNRYSRRRTAISLTSTATQVSGKLLDNQGNPVASSTVDITLQPTAGPGFVSTYTLTGKVPEVATRVTQGVLQICVNECGSQGPNDMNLYSYRYADSGMNAAQDFSKGLTGWAIPPPPNRTASVQLVSDSTGPSLLIKATPTQHTFVNSTFFPITPGSTFTLTVQARVSPASVGSGYFAMIFLDATGGSPVPRVTLPFAPGISRLGSPRTTGDGTYSLVFPAQPAGSMRLDASFAGSDTLWPAIASAPLGNIPAINANGIVNAATFQVTPLSPGAWFSIFGQNLGAAGQWAEANTTALGGAEVSVCGLSALMSYNSGPITNNGATGWQINALTPEGVAGQKSCPVLVTVSGVAAPPATVTIASGIAELFSFTSQAGVLPIVSHADYSLVGPASAGLVPAKPGEMVIAWGTGDCVTPAVTVAGSAAIVAFAGQAGPGLCQFNFVVPHGVTGGTDLRVSTSPTRYTLWVSP